MPEIAEVHRVVHFLRKHLLNRKISKVFAEDDTIVYGKVGTSAEEVKKSLTGKTVVGVKQQGKYFWMELSKPPHLLMHLGMTGYIHFSNENTEHYRKRERVEEWPPRFCKFRLVMDGKPDCEAAFADGRRLARIRLVDVAAEEMRKTSPLKENGPDPMVDRDIFTKEWLREKMSSRRVPVKAFLLNQTNISGIGNWVADEVLYHARVHPEQYSNTFTDSEMDRIHDAIIMVCTTACDLLADSNKFPDDWLMRHRWGKGKRNDSTLPNGQQITFITVGGRTSAFIAALQKKTGLVSDGLKIEAPAILEEGDETPIKATIQKSTHKSTSTRTKSASNPAKQIAESKTKTTKKKTAIKAELEVDHKSDTVIADLQPRRRSTRKSAPASFAPHVTSNSDEEVAASLPTKKRKVASVKTSTKAKRAKK